MDAGRGGDGVTRRSRTKRSLDVHEEVKILKRKARAFMYMHNRMRELHFQGACEQAPIEAPL